MQKLGLMTAAATLVAVFAFAGPAYADKAIGGLHCNETQASHPCTVQAFIDVTKERTDGPYTFDTEGPNNDGSRTDVDVDVDPNDDGGIAVGLDAPQHFAVEIVITNNSGGEVIDLVVFDKIPAEFNLDPDGEDDADGTFNGTCDDGVCNGIDLSLTGTCFLTEGQPAGAVAGPKDPSLDPFDQRFKQPELVSILIESIADTASCTFTLYLVTDGNPGHVTTDDGTPQGVKQCIQPDDGLPDDCELVSGGGLVGQILLFDLYEPGSCEKIAEVDGFNTADVNVYNTVSLNDGVKIFQVADDGDAADGTAAGVDEGFRLVATTTSLQLTPNGVVAAVVQENSGACPNTG